MVKTVEKFSFQGVRQDRTNKEKKQERERDALSQLEQKIALKGSLDIQHDDPDIKLAKLLRKSLPDYYVLLHYNQYNYATIKIKNKTAVDAERARYEEEGIDFDRTWFFDRESRMEQWAQWKRNQIHHC